MIVSIMFIIHLIVNVLVQKEVF